MNIKDEMLKSVSERRHARVKEICSVLDYNIDYNYEHTTNIERVKLLLSDYKFNKSYVSKNLLILNGKIKIIPDIEIVQGFICILIVSDKKVFNKTVKEHKLLTYEPDPRLYPNL